MESQAGMRDPQPYRVRPVLDRRLPPHHVSRLHVFRAKIQPCLCNRMWISFLRMSLGEPFLLGVNYWPRRKAMYWWSDFDARDVREEFAMIRGAGLTHVRIFLLWESFQPQPDRINAGALASLRSVCDIAAESSLKVEPTFFTGHMSGPNWAPDWLISGRPRRRYEREIVALARHTSASHTIYN